MSETNYFRNTYVQVNNQVIENNARSIISTFSYKYYIAVVKGNAYGHGYGIIAPLIKAGINCFAVSMLVEALKVRNQEPNMPIILLQPVSKEFLKICEDNNISVCINDEDTFHDVLSSGCRLNVHIKVDCGMNRLGVKDPDTLERIVRETVSSSNLRLEGIFSHFHTSGINDNEYGKNLEVFKNITKNIDLSTIPIVHIDKSLTMTAHEKPDFVNGVRLGIILYGFNSMAKYGNSFRDKLRIIKRDWNHKRNHVAPSLPYTELGLKTAFALYTEVIQVKKLLPGEYVGYGLLYQAKSEEYCAVIDTGYMDGISRRRSGSQVAIGGKRYPIIGEIGMGMTQVLVDKSVKKHDTVTVLGNEISIRSVAQHIGTTVYETMTGIDSSIPRKYIN